MIVAGRLPNALVRRKPDIKPTLNDTRSAIDFCWRKAAGHARVHLVIGKAQVYAVPRVANKAFPIGSLFCPGKKNRIEVHGV
jgi:hypothetical protein